MSTKLVLNKDFNYRTDINASKIKVRFVKLINSDLYLPIETRVYLTGKQNNKVSANSCKVRNRCILTGRSRAVFNYFKLTRMMFKNLAVKGYLVGLRKSSW
jgi:ribosomal protein S14